MNKSARGKAKHGDLQDQLKARRSPADEEPALKVGEGGHAPLNGRATMLVLGDELNCLGAMVSHRGHCQFYRATPGQKVRLVRC